MAARKAPRKPKKGARFLSRKIVLALTGDGLEVDVSAAYHRLVHEMKLPKGETEEWWNLRGPGFDVWHDDDPGQRTIVSRDAVTLPHHEWLAAPELTSTLLSRSPAGRRRTVRKLRVFRRYQVVPTT